MLIHYFTLLLDLPQKIFLASGKYAADKLRLSGHVPVIPLFALEMTILDNRVA